MATKGERQALLFLAAVALLGAGMRVYRAREIPVDSTDLDRQIDAVESSRGATGARARPSGRKRRPPNALPESTPSPPPAPDRWPLDLDLATAEEIERLPGIGPAIAKRIIGDRDANGAFGCLKALDGVKGVGPAMLGRIDSLVVFSGARRAPCASGDRLSAPRPG